jgi:hypothetical protein
LGAATVARVRQEIPEDVRHLVLCQQNIDEVMNRVEFWQRREIASWKPAHVFILRSDLIVRINRD